MSHFCSKFGIQVSKFSSVRDKNITFYDFVTLLLIVEKLSVNMLFSKRKLKYS